MKVQLKVTWIWLFSSRQSLKAFINFPLSLLLVENTQILRQWFITRHVQDDVLSLQRLKLLSCLKLIFWLLHTTLWFSSSLAFSSTSRYHTRIPLCIVFNPFIRSVETIQLHKPITLRHRKLHKSARRQSSHHQAHSSPFRHLNLKTIVHLCRDRMATNGRTG